MNKFKSIFKVLTFLDVEIFLLCTMMVLSLYFSNSFIKKSISTTKELTSEIIKNDYYILSLDEKYREFKNLDDELLFKSISGQKLDSSLIKLNSYKLYFYQYKNSELNNLLIKKENLFIGIHNAKNDSMFHNQIYKNILINIELRDIVDKYHSLKSLDNIKKQNDITEELYKNYKKYMIVFIVTIFVFIICISLIVIDIKKIYRKDDRNKYLISVLISKFTIH